MKACWTRASGRWLVPTGLSADNFRSVTRRFRVIRPFLLTEFPCSSTGDLRHVTYSDQSYNVGVGVDNSHSLMPEFKAFYPYICVHWNGWKVSNEPSPALLCKTQEAIGRNFGPGQSPGPVWKIWHLVWALYRALVWARHWPYLYLTRLIELFEHSTYQGQRLSVPMV